jgi:hypothetical protein
MAIAANETHKYHTRTAAREAAIDAGLNLDDLHICRAGDPLAWGWVSRLDGEAEESVKAAEDEFGPIEDQSAEAIMARNAARAAGEDIDATEDEAPAVADEADSDAIDIPDTAPSSDETADASTVYLRLGPISAADAATLAKKLGRKFRGAIVDDLGTELETFGPKARAAKLDKPKRIRVGSEVDEHDRPIRPYITHDKHRPSCDKLMDRVDAAAGDLGALLDLLDAPGFVPCDTYRKQVLAYRDNHIRYARKYGRAPANDAAHMMEAAD